MNTDLIIKLAEGNPGALTVISELQWYRNWEDMLKWMLKTGLTGHKIWEKYKDEYHQSWSMFGDWVQKETYKDVHEALK